MGKDDIFIKKIAGGEANTKGHQKGQDIGRNRDQSQVDIAFVEDIVVADEIEEDIQQGVRASADCVAEGLNGHQLAEGGVKKINEICDPRFDHIVHCLEARR